MIIFFKFIPSVYKTSFDIIPTEKEFFNFNHSSPFNNSFQNSEKYEFINDYGKIKINIANQKYLTIHEIYIEYINLVNNKTPHINFFTEFQIKNFTTINKIYSNDAQLIYQYIIYKHKVN